MAPEKKLWQDLKKATSTNVQWTRLEAWVGTGIPDLNGVILPTTVAPTNGIEFWLELKVCKTKSASLHSLWRPGQIAWQISRSRVCPNVFNLVHHPAGGRLYLYGGWQLTELTDGPMTKNRDPVTPLLDSPVGPESLLSVIHFIKDRLLKS